VSVRVLIIDDDVRLADMVGAYLTNAGFVVDARNTGHAGVEAVTARRATPYDVVVLDIMLGERRAHPHALGPWRGR